MAVAAYSCFHLGMSFSIARKENPSGNSCEIEANEDALPDPDANEIFFFNKVER
jgi:hypothetical protein